MVLYYVYNARAGAKDTKLFELPDQVPEEPSESERRVMDREYKLWRAIVAAAVIASVALYVVPYLAV